MGNCMKGRTLIPKKSTSNFENKINAIRRKLSHVTLILNCKGKLMQKQQNIKRKLKKMHGSVKTNRVHEIKAQLTHELKVQSKVLRDKRTGCGETMHQLVIQC